MENALQVADETPKEIYGIELKEGLKASALLQASMNRKKKKIFFNGKEYAEFHDLQVVCNYFGHSVRTYDAQPVDVNGVKGFKAHADLISKDGVHIGGAEAYCLQDEPNWARKPLFQLASMAQTRAAAKCITNDYRWVLDLAGYGTTPAEEMPTETPQGSTPPPPPSMLAEAVSTGVPVPKDYWELKKASKYQEAKVLLGGDNYVPRKIDGRWMICEKVLE